MLQVKNLVVGSKDGRVVLLNNLTFELASGESIGILGHSGAGKTTLARTLLRQLPSTIVVKSGSVLFNSIDLANAKERDWRKLRGRKIATIPQEPELALNPLLSVGLQIKEVVRAHYVEAKETVDKRARELMDTVGLPAQEFYYSFPHQLSGGERQRVTIAQALACRPSLLIADEPTSSLDTVAQSHTLRLLHTLQQQFRLSILFITHEPELLVGLVSKVLVLSDGRVAEYKDSPSKSLPSASHHQIGIA
jgi:peptide/nickel transport system ATP-binding protein